ncbi:hypothetical protein Y032_0114g449 [Ancylostoma ceylanicum]|nr:hypothetical protein Y032_0114g449 [Ancylostoma ceylanicum]
MTLQISKFNDDKTYSYIDTTFQVVYIYLTCTVTTCVVERSFATIFSSTYEYCRYWQVFIVGQLLSALVIFLHVHVYHIGGIISDMIMLCLSVLILTCLIALLVVNRRLTLSTRGLRSLSCRYQITENVRALRLLVPLVLFDTCVSVADMAGTLFFNVRPEFQPRNCASSPLYLPAYIVLRLSAVILQYAIPVCIIRHESVRKVVTMRCSRVSTSSQSSEHFEIKNVLGTILSKEGSQKNYFNYLHQQWKI